MVEDIINNVDGQVQVIFERGEGSLLYRDAIWMTQEEYNNTSSETLTTLKETRYNNWIDMINNPPVIVEPEPAVQALDNTDAEVLTQSQEETPAETPEV